MNALTAVLPRQTSTRVAAMMKYCMILLMFVVFTNGISGKFLCDRLLLDGS